MKHILKTMSGYRREWLRGDLLSGIVIAAVSIPISMGYAQIAGLPAVYGLYGSVLPIFLFAMLSTSPLFIFGVDAAPAAMVGAVLLSLGVAPGSAEAMQLVPALAFYTGLWLLLFSGCQAVLRPWRHRNRRRDDTARRFGLPGTWSRQRMGNSRTPQTGTGTAMERSTGWITGRY